MSEFRQRIGSLSPQELNLLESRLKQHALQTIEEERIPKTGNGPRRLSSAQERLWFIDRLEPAAASYNLAWALRLKGILDVAALQNALDAVVARQEALRTVFREVEGAPLQFVEAARPVEMRVIDAAEDAVDRTLTEEARRRFDLARDLMIRAALLRLQPEEHVLLLTLHHIAADGWSRGILLHELSVFYAAFAAGQTPRLPDLSVTYADFAQWQRHGLDSVPLGPQVAYWKKQLAGAPVALNLPLDHPRPASQTHNGARELLLLSPGLVEHLKALSLRENVTLFMTLLAAFQTLLYRYTEDSDIVVGTPAANRKRVETESLIGFFVNTVVVRTDLSGEPTFRQLLSRVREAALGAYANQDVPFEKLLDELNPPRRRSHSPIFQTMFVLLNAPRDVFDVPGLNAEVVEVETGASQFDLVMEIADRPAEMIVRLAYCTDLFEPATARRMLGHFETLLRAAVEDPDVPLSRLPLLTDAERQTLLVDWNATAAEYPESSADQLFEAHAAKTPHAIAATQETRQWTYTELSRQSDRIARHLRKLGVWPVALVAIYVERSLEMLAGLLGIWKAGAAYLPLDPAYPRQRIAFILEDAAPAVVLTEAKLRGALPESSAPLVLLEEALIAQTVSEQTLLTASGGASRDRLALDRLAYVIYTSGSTGKPKGVAIRHRSVTNLLNSMARLLGTAPSDVVLATTTISFDIAGLELFLPLISGARVAIVSREIASDGWRLARTIEESDVTIMQATPATWQMLLLTGWTGKGGLKMVCGGEALPATVAEKLRKTGRLWNVYGPTETTIWSTAARLTATDASLTIGRPLDNTQLYVLDRERQPVPVGVVGELYIGGVGLAQGYWNRPELTEEKFVSHPFRPAARLYRTGDLVRYLLDGNLDFLGRIDNQVKLRGFRIELGEIETVLGRHPGVGLCAVVVHQQADDDRILVAYFEADATHAPDAAAIRDHLKKELPDYMVPSAFVRVEKLPLTPSGKVDRKALPAPGELPIEAPGGFVPPRDPLEHALAQAWSKVLNVKQVGLRDDFFELGGHSLAAVRLLFEVQKITGRTLPLATLFQASTVEALAGILRKDGWMPSWSSLVPIQPLGLKPPLFLVHGAEGNVLLYRQVARHLEADQPVYGLQSQGLNGDTPTNLTVQEMAAAYVQEVLTVQPHGPYFFGGYCLGGIIAFEMAQQVTALGKKVELVLLLDTYNSCVVNRAKEPLQGVVHPLQNMWFHLANTASLPPGDLPQVSPARKSMSS